MKRALDMAVLSDLHLGSYNCKSDKLLFYLKSINPKILILAGDIIDIWQHKSNYWPDEHMKIVRRILKFIIKGTKVYYVIGNHDSFLCDYSGFRIKNFYVTNKLNIEIDGKKFLVVHGDIFDNYTYNGYILHKIGGYGYDLIMVLNRWINHFNSVLGLSHLKLIAYFKNRFETVKVYIDNFISRASKYACSHECDGIICGHIHKPDILIIDGICYLNSGDWVEHCTALEYSDKKWEIKYI